MNIVPIDNGKLRTNIQNLTSDQRKAYDALIDFINAPFNDNDYKRALIGPAGSGKTFLLKALIQNCKLVYSSIGAAAPTHKACRVLTESINIANIKINTIQSDLGLRVNFNSENFDISNPPFDPKGKVKIENLKLYIVDEASMIGDTSLGKNGIRKRGGLLTFLERVCKTNKCKVLYVGDGSQLPPVNEDYSAAFANIKLFKLNQIVRQDDDNPVKFLLNLLRKDIENKTYNFLNYIQQHRSAFNQFETKGYEVLTEQQFKDKVILNFNDVRLTKNVNFVKIVAYHNTTVSSWNKFVRSAIIQDADTSILTKHDLLISYTTIVDMFNQPLIKNSEDYILSDVINYVHPTYGLKGFMVRFQAIYGGAISPPMFVLNHNDKASMFKYIQILENLIKSATVATGGNRSQKWKEYYKFKDSCLILINILDSDGAKLKYGRNLDYGFSITSHKSQGSTYDNVFVDVDDIVFDSNGQFKANAEEINRCLYVACSRCKNKLFLKFCR